MVDEKTFCGECGLRLENVPEPRVPCLECGSTARTFHVNVEVNVKAFAQANATVISYPRALLSLSEKLIFENQFGVAIVVAHMACEISTERRLRSVAEEKKLQDLFEAIQSAMNGYSLGNKRNLEIYKSFSGDLIQTQPFWESYKNSCVMRNNIIHGGMIASKEDAKKSYICASKFVDHMGSRC